MKKLVDQCCTTSQLTAQNVFIYKIHITVRLTKETSSLNVTTIKTGDCLVGLLAYAFATRALWCRRRVVTRSLSAGSTRTVLQTILISLKWLKCERPLESHKN